VVAFVERAPDWFAAHGITARRLQTDNAWIYTRNRGLRDLLAERAIRHRTIPPRTPKRNGKVERTSRPSPANGPTGSATATQTPAPRRCPSGSSTTTTSEPQPLSNRPPISRVRNQPRHDS
jgi:transposase InsO family protein